MKYPLIIGGSHLTAVGNSLRHAAKEMNLSHEWLDYDEITRAPRWKRSFCWRFLDKQPPNLSGFNHTVLEICRRQQCDSVICAGNLPLTSDTLIKLADLGVLTSIWLTDDPWNPRHLSSRFIESLSHYGRIFTPRRSNFGQLNALAPGRIEYLPFGYDPRYFGPIDRENYLHDVFFAGGADQERATLIGYFLHAGIDVGLYGAYWERYKETRGKSSGYAAPDQLRSLIARSRVSLCLVRRSNRDGHSMRTFEIGACGAPLLAEDTIEHRDILGDEMETALYFDNEIDMVEKARWLIDNPEEGAAMGLRLGQRLRAGQNTYADRLRAIFTRSSIGK